MRLRPEAEGDGSADVTIASRIAGRYVVRDVVAKGGGGVILRANDARTRSDVLIKACAGHRPERDDLTEPLDAFVEDIRRNRHHLQTERRILVQLRRRCCNAVPHPNDYVFDVNPALEGPHRACSGELWTFDDEALVSSEPYLIMQPVAGERLDRLLAEESPGGIDEGRALDISDQLAGILELLHRPFHMANGQTWDVVYEDLKPSNVLLDARGRVALLDFGGCQVIIDGILVLHGSFTSGYAAPECEDWERRLTRAADCYSLGATLFHLLSGVDPRTFLRRDAIAARIDLRRLGERCSQGVIDLMARCIAWDPRARFESMDQLREALARLR